MKPPRTQMRNGSQSGNLPKLLCRSAHSIFTSKAAAIQANLCLQNAQSTCLPWRGKTLYKGPLFWNVLMSNLPKTFINQPSAWCYTPSITFANFLVLPAYSPASLSSCILPIEPLSLPHLAFFPVNHPINQLIFCA